jgi:oligopeptide transport system substrate-binding protein
MIAEAISQQWKQNLGIDVGTRNMEWKVYLENQNNLDYTISRSSWIGDYADPFTFFSIFRTDDGNNRTGWSCREYDELLDKVSVTLDRKERNNLFKELERLLVEQECPVLPIYDYVNKGLIKESVLGWEANIRDVHPLKYIWRE